MRNFYKEKCFSLYKQERKKKERTEELQQWEEKIEVEEHRNECLKHMKALKKVTFYIKIPKAYLFLKGIIIERKEKIPRKKRHSGFA